MILPKQAPPVERVKETVAVISRGSPVECEKKHGWCDSEGVYRISIENIADYVYCKAGVTFV